jgi:hypothetical protein
MGAMQVLVSGLATLVVYGVIVAGVVKLFQIANDLGEIKEALLDIKRNALDVSPAVLAARSPQIPALLTALARPHAPSASPVESPR